MKQIRRILITLCLIVSLFCISNVSVKGGNLKTYSDDGKYNYTTVTETIDKISQSTIHIKNEGFATRNGVDYPLTNHIMVADFSTDEDIKIVSWAVKNRDNTGFTRMAIKDIGEDYEKNHPGYIVLAGINADQYYMYFGTQLLVDSTDYFKNQSVYPLVADGENWFLRSPYGDSYISNTVGFKNDGSKNPLVYGRRTDLGMFIHVYDDNKNEIGMFPVNDLNITSELKENETTVLSVYHTSENGYCEINKKSDYDFYYVEHSDLCYVNNSVDYAFYKGDNAVNSFFGKGTISSICKEVTLKQSQFAIETRNDELKNALSVGTYVMVQYEFDEGFAGIKESAGFHTVQRLNGHDGDVANPYNSRPYPRSIVGCDSNGKIYLITNEGINSAPTVGMWAQESNALMKQYGITDAFQMDGGGSVACVMRNENGELEYAMPPVEGDYRYDLSGLFIVMRVTKATTEVKKVSQTTATIECNLSEVEEEYTNAYLGIGNNKEDTNFKYFKINDGICNIDGLNAGSKYYYALFLEDSSGKKTRTYIDKTFTTYENYPKVDSIYIEEIVNKKGEDKYLVTINVNEEYKMIRKINANINGKDYYAKYDNGIATVEIDKNVNSILLIKVTMQCVPQNVIEDIEERDFKLMATPDVFYSNAISTISSYIDNFYK